MKKVISGILISGILATVGMAIELKNDKYQKLTNQTKSVYSNFYYTGSKQYFRSADSSFATRTKYKFEDGFGKDETPTRAQFMIDMKFVENANKYLSQRFGGAIDMERLNGKSGVVNHQTKTLGDVMYSFMRFWRYVNKTTTTNDFKKLIDKFVSGIYFTSNDWFKNPKNSFDDLNGIKSVDKLYREMLVYSYPNKTRPKNDLVSGPYLINIIFMNKDNMDSMKEPDVKKLLSFIINNDFDKASELLKTSKYFEQKNNDFIKSLVEIEKNYGDK